MKKKLKIFLYADVLMIFILITLKIYLIVSISNFNSMNSKNINKIKNKSTFSFAVLGNVNNSISIFEKKIIPNLKKNNISFIILNGNSVLDGGESKYIALGKSLKRIKIPVITAIGYNEVTDGGKLRFYKHFGQFYFSFVSGNSYFIFLDTTGTTPKYFQNNWLLKELKLSMNYKNRFIFLNKAPYKFEKPFLFDIGGKYIQDKQEQNFFVDTFSKYNVTSVFSSSIPIYDKRTIKGVTYYVSGGAGGSLFLDNKNKFYDYIKVDVSPTKVDYSLKEIGKKSKIDIYNFIKNIFGYFYSVIYVDAINFFIILTFLIFIGILLYKKTSKEVDYYESFVKKSKETKEKNKLNIAMFTNNYLPFIGGVPISIKRLSDSLRKQGHNVYIFAPKYIEKDLNDNEFIIRCKPLIYYKIGKIKFPITNIFSPEIKKKFILFNIDIVHVHHPFWLGRVGLKLAKKYNKPIILTYHTRLEYYAHYLPFFKLIFKNIISHEMIKNFSQQCDTIFAPTKEAKNYLRNIGVSRKIEVFPTGIDFSIYNNVEKTLKKRADKKNDEVILYSIARLTKEKNLYFLLDGVKYIKEHITNHFKVIIAGDGPEKENLLNVIKLKKLENVVQLLGSVSQKEIIEYSFKSDIFIFASKSETQGMVLLEAMAGGTPVVAVRASGIEDMIKDGFNGFKTEENIEEWAERVMFLIKNPEELRKMSENAKSFSKEFSTEGMAKKALNSYFNSIENFNKGSE